MPRGGFGNLIALAAPARTAAAGQQRLHRRRLRTLRGPVGVPRVRFTASTPRSRRKSPGTRHERGQVVGVRVSPRPTDDEEAAAPWMRPPSGHVPCDADRRSRAAVVNAVLAQRLFVEKAGLPSPLLNRDQTSRSLPEPGVLQEAEHAPVDGADAARDLVRRGSSPAHRTPARVRAGCSKGCFASTVSELAIEDQRHDGDAARSTSSAASCTAVQREAAARSLARRHRASSSRLPASARPSWARTWSRSAAAQHARSSCTGSRCSTNGSRSSRCFLGLDEKDDRPDRRRQAQAQRPPRCRDDPEPRAEGQGRRRRRRIRPRHRRRVPPPPGGLVRARALGGEGAVSSWG